MSERETRERNYPEFQVIKAKVGFKLKHGSISGLRTKKIFVDPHNQTRGHLKDSRQVKCDCGEWIYEPQ